MKKLLFILLIFTPNLALSAGLLGDVQMDMEKIVKDKSLSRDGALIAEQAYMKIERAALAQSLQEDALTKRIISLESVVKKQQEIISKYEVIVADLQGKLQQDKK